MVLSTGRGQGLLTAMLLGTACSALGAACGNGDDLDPTVGAELPEEPVVIRPARPQPSVAGDTDGASDGAEPTPPGGANGDDDAAEGEEDVDRDPSACRTPNGVSGRPATIGEAMILMNSLPRPTTLACFLQALERPLSLYMTSSNESLQPSPGARSPRTFVVNQPLVMSIVFDGPAQATLELGYRTTPSRSIKTEIVFPLTTDVTYGNLFDAVQREGTLTRCGACHTAEVRTVTPTLPMDVFESDVNPPLEPLSVDLASLRNERETCDAAAEPERCALLSAVFDFGDVEGAPNGLAIISP